MDEEVENVGLVRGMLSSLAIWDEAALPAEVLAVEASEVEALAVDSEAADSEAEVLREVGKKQNLKQP